MFDGLIEEKVADSIKAVRETLSKAGLASTDVERIVFVGGPTKYKPLRDKVSFELGIPASTEVNPMTAVAEGAALFAESIEWISQSRGRKSSRGKLASGGKLDVAFNYTARSPGARAKVVVQVSGQVTPGAEFQIDSMDTGWTSGRLPLTNGAAVDVSLSKNGENVFKVFVFDANGGPFRLEQDRIVVTRTAATVEAIPASHSIGIEVLDKLGGTPAIQWLVRAGDQLPKRGRERVTAGESVKAGSGNSLNIRLLEGESDDPADNRFIGMLKITGADFAQGVIPSGAVLHCDYEMLDSGNIVLEVSVPQVGATFHSGRNFYSPQEGKLDFSSQAASVVEEGDSTLRRLHEIENVVDDPQLARVRRKLESASLLDPDEPDIERTQQAMEDVIEARRILAEVRKGNLKEIRQMELSRATDFFDQHVREHARPSEETSFDNLARTIQRSIDRNDRDFEMHLAELNSKTFAILWRQDWFVVERFKWMADSPHHFSDPASFQELIELGQGHIRSDDIDALRQVVGRLAQTQIDTGSDTDMLAIANIIRG